MIKRIKNILISIIEFIEKIDEEISDRFVILFTRRGKSIPFGKVLKDLGLTEKDFKD